MYVEASLAMLEDVASLQSPLFHQTKPMCLQFFYHMFGKHIGSLNVYVMERESQHWVLAINRSQSDNWEQATVEVNVEKCQRGNCSIRFEAMRGNGSNGDIAIDDISLDTGPCEQLGKQICLG